MVAVAIGGAAVLGAGASVVASSKASKTAKSTAAANNELQTQVYNSNKETLAPFVATGAPATSSIQALLGLSPGGADAQNAAFANFRNSSGYNFRLAEGTKAVTSALGKRGQLESGAGDKALVQYGQNAGSDEFGRYMAALTGQQNVGLTAASAQAGVGTGYANSASANNNAAANTSANAALSNAASINSALSSGVSAYALSAGLKSSYAAPSTAGFI